MSLFEWFKNLFSHDAVQRTRLPIAKANDLTGRSGAVAKADEHYVRLYFSELFLQKDRNWFTSRFPLGYSLICHKYGDQPKVEFTNVAGKNKFDIQQASQDRSILRNYPMTPLLPFRGGDIEIDCGLVSMQASNLLESFAKTVGDIAGKLNAPQASTVVSIASSIATGVQELLSAGKAETVLYVHDMFTGKSLTSGYLLLARNPLQTFEGQTLWMTDDGIRVGPSSDALAPIEPQDFLVIFVECLEDRDDWQSLGAVGKPLDKAIEAKLGGRNDEAKLLLVQAKVAAITSPDLTRRDGKRVVAAIDAYYKDGAAIQETIARVTRNALTRSITPSDDRLSLHLAPAVARVTVADADKLPEATLNSLL
ncbi:MULTISPECIES: hypothetical protein [unclassified Bradyrhizobium]|uniref:hypothetical protein n=1 Tax=unclassified Bradyrhizobium TaxID=2631580 RepID=UPI0028E6892B|nr:MULTISPECIES: hypothetical protein [unclassified Bradyrhizobium]